MFNLAHYWGIDEVGIYVLPALFAIVALRWAERKARRAAAEAEEVDEADDEEQGAEPEKELNVE